MNLSLRAFLFGHLKLTSGFKTHLGSSVTNIEHCARPTIFMISVLTIESKGCFVKIDFAPEAALFLHVQLRKPTQPLATTK